MRPTDYTPEIATAICADISGGEKLGDICDANAAYPHKRTVYRWLSVHEEFRHQYARAMEDRTHAMAEELLEIADDGRNDWMEKNHGENAVWVENGEAMGRSRIRIDTRKWLMSKMAPKKYGDKITQEHQGPDGGALVVNIVKKTYADAD